MTLLDLAVASALDLAALQRAALTHAVADLEAALVAELLSDAGVTVEHNHLLLALLRPTPARQAAREALGTRSRPLTFGDLVKAFEVLLPASDAQHQGAVFTPPTVSTHLARRLLCEDDARARVLDPSCGCGALLLAALDRLCALGEASPRDVLERQIHGVDLSPTSLERARVLLTLACVILGDDVEEVRLNLQCGDSLTLDWDEAFPAGATFDVVIGNPPYVRYQNMDPQQRASLAARWETAGHGNFNLYFVFFELAAERAGAQGRIGYITPNSFFASASGRALRSWLSSRRLLEEIVDFGHAKVFDALTYTALTFMSARPRTTLRYAQVPSGACALATLGESEFQVLSQDRLGSAPWRLTGRAHAEAVARIGSGRTLGEVADIRYGVKTCRDRLYLIQGTPDQDGMLQKKVGTTLHPVEAALTLPHACVPDLSDDAAVLTSTQRIIYPYEVRDGRAHVLAEDVLRERYPAGHAYLTAVRGELAQRDKGRKVYAQWYAYGRTQGLVPAGPRLLTPEYAARPRFLLDPRRDSLFSNGCSVTPRAGSDLRLDTLAALLRSAVCHYFVAQTSTVIDGGYFSYQKTRIAGLGVPDLTDAEQSELVALAPGDADAWLSDLYGITLPAEYIRSGRVADPG